MPKPTYLLRASWVSLHTGDPSVYDGGRQLTHEVAYEGYKRVQVKCKVKKRGIVLAEDAIFPTCTADDQKLVTYWGLGTEASDNGVVWWYGEIQPPLWIVCGVSPRILIKGSLIARIGVDL